MEAPFKPNLIHKFARDPACFPMGAHSEKSIDVRLEKLKSKINKAVHALASSAESRKDLESIFARIEESKNSKLIKKCQAFCHLLQPLLPNDTLIKVPHSWGSFNYRRSGGIDELSNIIMNLLENLETIARSESINNFLCYAHERLKTVEAGASLFPTIVAFCRLCVELNRKQIKIPADLKQVLDRKYIFILGENQVKHSISSEIALALMIDSPFFETRLSKSDIIGLPDWDKESFLLYIETLYSKEKPDNQMLLDLAALFKAMASRTGIYTQFRFIRAFIESTLMTGFLSWTNESCENVKQILNTCDELGLPEARGMCFDIMENLIQEIYGKTTNRASRFAYVQGKLSYAEDNLRYNPEDFYSLIDLASQCCEPTERQRFINLLNPIINSLLVKHVDIGNRLRDLMQYAKCQKSQEIIDEDGFVLLEEDFVNVEDVRSEGFTLDFRAVSKSDLSKNLVYFNGEIKELRLTDADFSDKEKHLIQNTYPDAHILFF